MKKLHYQVNCKAITLLAICTLMFLGVEASADLAGNPEKISGWVVVYERDSNGAVLRGNRNRLATSLRSGADIRVGFNLAGFGQTLLCENASIFEFASEEHVGCVFTQVALIDGIDPLSIRSTPYYAFQWIDTLGRNAVARASIYGGANFSQTISQAGTMTWFARVR